MTLDRAWIARAAKRGQANGHAPPGRLVVVPGGFPLSSVQTWRAERAMAVSAPCASNHFTMATCSGDS